MKPIYVKEVYDTKRMLSPSSPKAVRESLEVILPALPHAIEILRGDAGASNRHEYKT